LSVVPVRRRKWIKLSAGQFTPLARNTCAEDRSPEQALPLSTEIDRFPGVMVVEVTVKV